MKKLNFLFFVVLIVLLGINIACSDDDSDNDMADPCDSLEATYDGDVKALIDASCAFAGCHDGTGTNTIIPASAGDFTSYAGLRESLNNETFNNRVLVQKNMPPNPAFALSDEQLELLTCWKDAGYPEM